MEIHEAYKTSTIRSYPSTFEEAHVPGVLLGSSALASFFEAGDVVTSIEDLNFKGTHLYYYDPKFRIEGNHWIRAYTNPTWVKLRVSPLD